MRNVKLFPYKMGSLSGKALAQALGIRRVRPTYEAKRRDTIINWGNSVAPSSIPGAFQDLNKPSAIALACNKLKTFQTLNDGRFIHVPEWTTHPPQATMWLEEGYKVYCRTHLTGHSGSGIILASTVDELVTAPLYTKNTKHKYEYRVHVFKGSVIDVQQKKRRNGYQGARDTGIRNHSNGYIYARADFEYPTSIEQASIDAVNLLGLDFGAVDIGYRERDNKIFVFEINTAPGLTGTTLLKYTQAIKEYLNGT